MAKLPGEVPATNTDEARHFALEKGDAYDRITLEGGYFDYPATAARIDELLAAKSDILELCVGTGSLAVELVRLGHSVTGLDYSGEMLAKCQARTDELDLPVRLEQGSAINFDLQQQYDAVVLHSGHLILNRYKGSAPRLNTDGEPFKVVEQTLASVSRHLKPGGTFIMNIEDWDEKVVVYDDGSIYMRLIQEDTEKSGTRVHIFARKVEDEDGSSHFEFDNEWRLKNPKFPLRRFVRQFAKHGFEPPAQHPAGSDLPALFYAVKSV